MPRQLSNEEIAGLGVTFSGREMEGNGELRVSMMGPDGSGTILIIAGSSGGWQDGHFHVGAIESYHVQFGKIIFAELQAYGTVNLTIVEAGGMVQSRPGIAHNVYMFAGATTFMIKFGNTDVKTYLHCGNPEKGFNDWWPSAEVDQLTLNNPTLSETLILDWEWCRAEAAARDGSSWSITVLQTGTIGISKV